MQMHVDVLMLDVPFADSMITIRLKDSPLERIIINDHSQKTSIIQVLSQEKRIIICTLYIHVQ